MSSSRATTDRNWRSFDRAAETERSFVLLARPFDGPGRRIRLFCYLPKTALPHPAEAARLRALLPGGVRAR